MRSTRGDSNGAISFIIPTRNRREILERTLGRLHSIVAADDEIIVVDNASRDGTAELLRTRFPDVRSITLESNISAAARNVAAGAASGAILFMLDDDSVPEPDAVRGVRWAFADDPRLGAIACRIRRATDPQRHDVGGLAGVIVNCGAAVRRRAFLDVGGYPVDFEYYAEEYDLCCRLWRGGWRVEPRGDLGVVHERAAVNRDANAMLRRLVRNNLRVWWRYSPPALRDRLLEETVDHYRRIARRERAVEGFETGLALARSDALRHPVRSSPLTMPQFEGLFGLDAARDRLRRQKDRLALRRVGIWRRGKGCAQLIDLLRELRLDVVRIYEPDASDGGEWLGIPIRSKIDERDRRPDALVPGTLSLGAAEDQVRELRTLDAGMPIIIALNWTATVSAHAASA
ncbi:MAG: glycosyltransferase [Phycisphaerae bacterium]|nr:glycosyltransferase [Phycisphaerae bacterium]